MTWAARVQTPELCVDGSLLTLVLMCGVVVVGGGWGKDSLLGS
jgi:hypothetical protein